MKYTRELLEQFAPLADSFAGLARLLDIAPVGSNTTNLANRCAQHNIDTSHFLGSAHRKGRPPKNKFTSDQVLVLGTREEGRIGSRRLRNAMMDKNVPYCCNTCNNPGVWMGNLIRLQVDHINGMYWDNRKENLRFLCPNCHVQTETWGNSSRITDDEIIQAIPKCLSVCDVGQALGISANHRHYERVRYIMTKHPTVMFKAKATVVNSKVRELKVRKASSLFGDELPFTKEDLASLLWKYPTTSIAKRYGLSDNGLTRWINRFGLSKPPRGYWAKKYAGALK